MPRTYSRTILRVINSKKEVIFKETVALSSSAMDKHMREMLKKFPACEISQVCHWDDLRPEIQQSMIKRNENIAYWQEG